MLLAKRAAPALAGLAVGLLAGAYFGGAFDVSSYRFFRDTTSGYSFISPLLLVSLSEDESFPEYRPLKNALERFANDAKARGDVRDLSIFFMNIDSGQWVGVNSDERFTPASMLKVATLVAALDAAQDDPSLLAKRVRAIGEDVPQGAYPPADPVQPGSVYLIRDLVERLVKQSDNHANETLVAVAGSDRGRRVYEDLQIPLPKEGIESGYTAREYSRIFRALYNGTYLSRDASEYALGLLSEADFKAGLVSGVPAGTVVAHKFGVHTEKGENGLVQELHDCGIVYYPGQPYFLCVMTRGAEFPALERVLSGASRAVWEEMKELDPA